eukprot:TRINITY_DN2879_c0_g3_i1.p1 TRINITY_DN2879_c0_g3~~TRINITY_DN2879_c0_g3_i1.p1  ORF type:complete len:104 (+),score=30.41 TRINITY_DN2879_c0_g3_i1:74-385(+)
MSKVDGFPGYGWNTPKGYPAALKTKIHLINGKGDDTGSSSEVEQGSCRAYVYAAGAMGVWKGRQQGFKQGYIDGHAQGMKDTMPGTSSNVANIGAGIGMKGGF